MSRRILATAILAVLAFAPQAIYAPAAQVFRQMQASRCCAENCKHEFTSPTRCGCCQLRGVSETTSTTPPPKASLTVPAGNVTIIQAANVIEPAGGRAIRRVSAAPRAAPVFLLTLNIRV
jgi:hypothetical protein